MYSYTHQRDYCAQLRNQIQANTDSVIEQINEMNQEMTQKINKYETDSIQNFESKPENKFEYNAIWKETEKLIKQFELTGDQVRNFMHFLF